MTIAIEPAALETITEKFGRNKFSYFVARSIGIEWTDLMELTLSGDLRELPFGEFQLTADSITALRRIFASMGK